MKNQRAIRNTVGANTNHVRFKRNGLVRLFKPKYMTRAYAVN